MVNVAAFKEFVPGKVMIIVLVLLALLGAAYLNSVDRRGDHLTRRNFHSLIAISENIGASLKALDAVVTFSGQACVPSKIDERTSNQKSYAQCIRDLIGKDGTALSGGVIRKIQVLPCPSEDGKPGENCVSDTEFNSSSTPGFYLNNGGVILAGSLLRRQYHTCASVGGSPDTHLQPQPDCKTLEIDYDVLESNQAREGFFDATVIADYEADKPFAEVISNSANGGMKVNADDIRQLFSSRSESNRLRTLQELELSAANTRAQAVTLTPDGVKPIDSSGGKPLPFSQSTVTSTEIGGQSYYAFIQPMDVDLEITNDLVIVGLVRLASFNQSKYQLPFNLVYVLLLLLLIAGLVVSLVHLAMIGKRELLHRKNTLLANLSVLGLQAIAVLIVMQIAAVQDFNELFKTSNKGIFKAIKAEFDVELDERLARLIDFEPTLLLTKSAAKHISGCNIKGNSILYVTSKGGYSDSSDPSGRPCVEQNSNDEEKAVSAQRIGFKSDHYLGVENIFQLNRSGTQIGTYASNKSKPASLGFKVPDRDYFTNIVNGTSWVYHASDGRKSHLNGRRFFLTKIESKLDGEKAIVISVPALAELPPGYLNCQIDSPEPDQCPDIKPAVTAYTTHLQSLRHTVLPVGFGFAVIENISGEVLFHSDDRRSLRENFYQATDDNDLLKARVISAAPSEITLEYKGETIAAQLGPLKDGIPWTLVVYHHTSVPDVVSFHFGITGGLLAILHLIAAGMLVAILITLLGFTVTRPGQRENFRWRKVLQLPQWMCPLRARVYEYRLLNLCFLAVLPIYMGVVYYIDTLLWFWYFIVPLLTVAVWHRLIRNEYYKRSLAEGLEARPRAVMVGHLIILASISVTIFALLSIARAGGWLYASICVLWILICFIISLLAPIYLNSRQPRKGLSVYRLTVTLFGLLTAMLPTLLLLNHNYDIHERLWVHFSSWSTVDHLKARHIGLQRDASKVRFSGSIREYMLNSWRGVYLPRTEIFSVRDLDPAGGETSYQEATRHTSDSLLHTGERSEYYNGYLLARANELGHSLHDEIDINLGIKPQDSNLAFYEKEKVLGGDFSLPRLIAQWSPNLSDMDDMIESFDEKAQEALSESTNTGYSRGPCVVLSETGHLVACIAELLGAWFPSNTPTTTVPDPQVVHIEKVAGKGQDPDWKLPRDRGQQISAIENSPYYGATYYLEADDRGEIEYRFLNWYPHTRSLNPFLDLLQNMLFVLSVGWLFWILNGWLIRRFFSDAFEVDLYPYPAQNLNHPTPMDSGGIIVTPPGTQMDEANLAPDGIVGHEDWGELIDLDTGDTECSSGWVLKQSVSSNLLVAWLQCQRMDDEVLSPGLLILFKKLAEQGASIIFLCDLDIRYALTETRRTMQQATSGSQLLSTQNGLAWSAFFSNYKTFFLTHYPLARASFVSESLCHAWEKSSKDEQMALAGLFYEDRINPKNTRTLNSLYRRGLILASNYGCRLCRPEMANVIKDHYPLEEYKEERKSYENDTWLTWRKPILVVLTLLMAFVLFVARDQLSGIFSIFATVLTGLATVGLISERIRQFSSSLLNKVD